MRHIKLAALVRACHVQFFCVDFAAAPECAGVLGGTLVALMLSEKDPGSLYNGTLAWLVTKYRGRDLK